MAYQGGYSCIRVMGALSETLSGHMRNPFRKRIVVVAQCGCSMGCSLLQQPGAARLR